jgi:hypothetical protein
MAAPKGLRPAFDDPPHGGHQPGEVVRIDGEGRRQIDDAAERPHPDALVEERPAQPCGLRPVREFNDADAAEHPHIADARKPAAWLEALRQRCRQGGHLRQARLGFKKVERSVTGGAGESVAHVCRPVHQGVQRVVGPERLEDVSARHRGREWQRAAGERLRQRDDIRNHLGSLAGE